MVDQNNKPIPSDLTIPSNYVAVKPGVYKPRQRLIKGREDNTIDLYQVPMGMALGVADLSSAVFVYKQGTIEVVGNVYHGRKKVKPGIYSVFEKLRYIDGTEVLPFNFTTQHYKRTPYNQNVHIPNEYVKQYRDTQTHEIAQYLYVDFDRQITTTDGNKAYPIPILNGKLRLYPDGSFEIENIVVRSTDGRQYHQVGYLGDHEDNTAIPVFFNDITKDDLDPFNVYQLLEQHEDGSITYGAIEANKQIQSNRFAILPPGIIPINDGKVTIDNQGMMYLEGTVINENGYRIIVDTLTPHELTLINSYKYKEITESDDEYSDRLSKMIDVNYRWNPSDKYNYLYLVAFPNSGIKYRYHPVNESYTIHRNDDGELIATYHASPHWDKFIPLDFTRIIQSNDWMNGVIPNNYIYNSTLYIFRNWRELALDWLNKYKSEAVNPVDIDEIKSYFPLVLKEATTVGQKILQPKYRIGLDGKFDYYITLDHTRYLDQEGLSYIHTYPLKTTTLTPVTGLPVNTKIPRINRLFTQYENNVNHQPWINIYNNLDDKEKIITSSTDRVIKTKFIPYLFPNQITTNTTIEQLTTLLKQNSIIISLVPENEREVDDSTIYQITVSGSVIWKRNNKYYLLSEGTALLDETWPDIVDKDDEPAELFTVNGYFKEEPIFIHKRDNLKLNVGNAFSTLDGIRRQEKGLFRLVSRDVTLFLSEQDNALIDNTHGQFLDNHYNENTGYIDYQSGYYRGIPYTAFDTGIHLCYHAFKTNNILPTGLQDVSKLTIYSPTQRNVTIDTNPATAAKNYKRLFSYDKNHFNINVYTDIFVQLAQSYKNNTISSFSLSVAKQNGYSLINKTSICNLITDNQYLLSYTRDSNTMRTIPTQYPLLSHDPIYHYSEYYTLTLPEYVTVRDGMSYIEGRGTPGVKLIYHDYIDLESTTGEIIIPDSGKFQIQIPPILDLYGYTEVFVDEPFNPTPNVYKINWRGPNHQSAGYTRPLELIEVERLTTVSQYIYGHGEPLSTISLYSPDDLFNPLSTTTVNENGTWTIDIINTPLRLDTLYQVTMITVWGETQNETFKAGVKEYYLNDYISPMELYNREEYAVPINIMVKGNQNTINIESSITFNTETNQYTIKGIVAFVPDNDVNQVTKVFKEGTYNYGVTPEIIDATRLFASNANGFILGTEPMIREMDIGKYVITTEGYTVYAPLLVNNIGISSGHYDYQGQQYPYTNDGYIFTQRLKTNYIQYIDSLSSNAWSTKHRLLSKDNAKYLINNIEKVIDNSTLTSQFIGPFDDSLMAIGIVAFRLPGFNTPVYLYNEYNESITNPLIYTPERFFSSLNVTQPWIDKMRRGLIDGFTRKDLRLINPEVSTKEVFVGIPEYAYGEGDSIISSGSDDGKVAIGSVLLKTRSDVITTDDPIYALPREYRYYINDRELNFPLGHDEINPLLTHHIQKWDTIRDVRLNPVTNPATVLRHEVWLS